MKSWVGRIVALLYVACATLPSLICVFHEQASELGSSSRTSILIGMYNASVVKGLATCPVALVVLGVVSLYLSPVATLLLTYDVFASDRRKVLHAIFATRASCTSIFFGRVLGTSVTCVLIYLASHVIVAT
jgi:hypothetical protein